MDFQHEIYMKILAAADLSQGDIGEKGAMRIKTESGQRRRLP